jgi:hypothetical protein
MSKKDEFKKFILNKPELIDYVEKHNSSWQKLYEIYDLYGDNSEVWSKYLTVKANSQVDIKGLLNTLKSINLDSLEENITQVQKVVDLVSEFTKKDSSESSSNYKEEKLENIYGDNSENTSIK